MTLTRSIASSFSTTEVVMFMILLIVFLAIAAVIASKILSRSFLEANNEITTSIFEALSVAYIGLLSFAAIISWQNFDTAQAHVTEEAQCVVNLYNNSKAFADPYRQNIQLLIKKYINTATTEEWELLSQGAESISAVIILTKLWDYYTKNYTHLKESDAFFSESVTQLNKLMDIRRVRTEDAIKSINPVFYYVLLLYSLLVVIYALLLNTNNTGMRFFSCLALSLGAILILYIILVFNYPYAGNKLASISHTTYLRAVSSIYL